MVLFHIVLSRYVVLNYTGECLFHEICHNLKILNFRPTRILIHFSFSNQFGKHGVSVAGFQCSIFCIFYHNDLQIGNVNDPFDLKKYLDEQVANAQSLDHELRYDPWIPGCKLNFHN